MALCDLEHDANEPPVVDHCVDAPRSAQRIDTTMGAPRHLFISYSSVDAVFVEKLRDFLVSQGYDVWLDTEKHHVGDWHEPVREAVRYAIAVLLVVTADSKKSENVKMEWDYALRNSVTVIPLVLTSKEDIDQRLHGCSRVDFTDSSSQNWDDLIRKIIARYNDLGIRVQAPVESSEHLKQLVSFINSPIPNLRQEAVSELGKLQNELQFVEPVFRQILNELTSPEFAKVREETVRSMRNNSDLRFLLNLQIALKDESPTIRHIAAEALGDLGDMSSELGFIATLNDPDPTVRMAAAYALGQLKSTSAIPHLRALLQDEHAGARKRAQEALERIWGG